MYKNTARGSSVKRGKQFSLKAFWRQQMQYNNFFVNSNHVNRAIDIMEKLLPDKHLMLSSAKRVKALILEEIALDSAPANGSDQNLFFKSETLHLSALLLAKDAFGENNVQTAKHYGNLGRLYQSMRRYKVRYKFSKKKSIPIMSALNNSKYYC